MGIKPLQSAGVPCLTFSFSNSTALFQSPFAASLLLVAVCSAPAHGADCSMGPQGCKRFWVCWFYWAIFWHQQPAEQQPTGQQQKQQQATTKEATHQQSWHHLSPNNETDEPYCKQHCTYASMGGRGRMVAAAGQGLQERQGQGQRGFPSQRKRAMDPTILRQPSLPSQPPITTAEASTSTNTTVTDPRERSASYDARQQGQQRPNRLDLLQQVMLLPTLCQEAILRELEGKACQRARSLPHSYAPRSR